MPRSRHLFLLIFTALLMLPVLSLLGAWLPVGMPGVQANAILREMAATVLPDYISTTLWLCLLVTVGVMLVGLSTAAAVTLFDFPGRRFFEWALLLPLAMPAYVVAYAYTDFLQYSGPLQTWLREATGLQGRVFPEIRNTAGAAWVLTFALYPYVYLLARTALAERASHLMEAARLLGAPLSRRIREVALPLARPAVVAGVALALMETLADFGVVSYFGVQTFTAGIYKAWLAMDNRVAAAQLATLLLGLVVLLLWLEHRSRRRLRFVSSRLGRESGTEARPLPLRGGRMGGAWAVCVLPLLMGFVAPVLFMFRPLVADWNVLPWDRFLGWAANSVRLGLLAAVLAVALALLLAFALRRLPDLLTRTVVWLAGLGYAVPGAVIVVGLLLPVGWVQATWPEVGAAYWITATSMGLLWAYLVRFVAVALQSVQSGYARIPASLDDSARMLGSGGAGLLRRVHWPLLRRSAVAAFQLARDERLGEAALPSLALVLVGLIPVLLLSRTLRHQNG
jgi:iron(III) transport system permease protein